MMRKVLCIAIVGILLLVTTNVVSKSTNKIKETKISNLLYNDCPCNIDKFDLDKEELKWYPFKYIICGFLAIAALIAGIFQSNIPWGIYAIANDLGCSWSEDIP